MEKSATLNLQINPALKEQKATASVNADLMTADEIHTKKCSFVAERREKR